MKTVLKVVFYTLLSLVLLFGIFLGISTLIDFKPEPIEYLKKSTGQTIQVSDTIEIFNWNIGYGGLGADMSFFYDGGEKVRTTKEQTNENLKEILNIIDDYKAVDFLLFQEVDLNSRRSYGINQMEMISTELNDFVGQIAINYKVMFVPVPPTNPMGRVRSGIVTYSRVEPVEMVRYSFLGNYSWPKGLFMLDRCFMVHRYNTSDGKQLLIINTHNEAYDTGFLRKEQMNMMKEFLLSEYQKGNYIMVGGDWNQNPPVTGQIESVTKDGHLTRIRISDDFLPEGWSWVFSDSIPTNRMIDKAYDAKTTETTVIDFFLLSPNLEKIDQQNIDLKFKNSDHNPVFISFKFKTEK